MRPNLSRAAAAWGLIIAGFVLVYHRVMAGLVRDWWMDGNYSHGFLIVPIAAYLLWGRRTSFGAATARPSSAGLILLIASLALCATGIVGSEMFLTRISILGVVAGVVLYLYGWTHLRIAAFPIALLILMIPLPAIVFNQIAFPLQLLASRTGEWALASMDIPVLREGNVLVLSNTTLEVAEACSGIRSLISLLTLGILLGYWADPRRWVRAAIALSSVPVAIVANGARVAGTGIAAHAFGPQAAEGFLHEFSGGIVFIVALFLMLGLQRVICTFGAAPVGPTPQPSITV